MLTDALFYGVCRCPEKSYFVNSKRAAENLQGSGLCPTFASGNSFQVINLNPDALLLATAGCQEEHLKKQYEKIFYYGNDYIDAVLLREEK